MGLKLVNPAERPLRELLELHSQLGGMTPYLDVAFVALTQHAAPSQLLALRISAVAKRPRQCEFKGVDWVAKRASMASSELATLVAQLPGGGVTILGEQLAFPAHTHWNLSPFRAVLGGPLAGHQRVTATGSGTAIGSAFASLEALHAWRERISLHDDVYDAKDLLAKLGLTQDFSSETSHRQTLVEVEFPLLIEKVVLTATSFACEIRLDVDSEAELPVAIKLRNAATEATGSQRCVLTARPMALQWVTATPGAGNVAISVAINTGSHRLFEYQFSRYLADREVPGNDAPARSERDSVSLKGLAGGAPMVATRPIGDVAPTPGAELSGVTVCGRWFLMAKIGSGGYGAVYEARHVVTNFECAVKVIPCEVAAEETVERLKRETRATNDVRHPAIVQVFDAGVDASFGVAIAAMERLRGAPLMTRLGRPMLPAEAWHLLRVPLEALSLCHDRGVYHRDISPSNLFVTEYHGTKILDFGLCYLVGRQRVTGSKVALGNPEYASPEQLMGAVEPIPATDIWSMGVILYQMLTGVHPFQGATDAATLVAAATTAHVSAVEYGVDDGLALVVDRCLQKRPEERFSDARSLYDELARLL